MEKEHQIREFLVWWLMILLGSFHKNVYFQEEDYRELVSISHNMEEQYGQFFDSVIPFEEVEFVLKQLMYEISFLEVNASQVGRGNPNPNLVQLILD